MIIEGEWDKAIQTWIIPHPKEKVLIQWNQIYACDYCSKKDKEGTVPDYYHIHHIKDTINTDYFADLDHLKTYLTKTQNDFLTKETTKDTPEPENMSDQTTSLKFAIWKPKQKKYPKGAIILKFVETHGGIRVRVVNNLGQNTPNGALFFIKKNIRVYEHVDPSLGLSLVQNNRLTVK